MMDVCDIIKQIVTIKNGNISLVDIEALVYLIQRELGINVGARFEMRFNQLYSEDVVDCIEMLENEGVIRAIEKSVEAEGYKMTYATDYVILQPVPVDRRIADYVNKFKEKLEASEHAYRLSHQEG